MIGKLLAVGGAGVAFALVGSQLGWFEGPTGRRARKELGAAFRRIPLPHFVLHLPTTAFEIEGLDDALCECALSSGAAQGLSHSELISLLDAVQKCTADLLFPDVDWPPVHSDNPTIHQYWAILDQRYRRLVFSGEMGQFCGLGPVAPPPIVSDIQPRSVVAGTKPLVIFAGGFSAITTVAVVAEDGTQLAVELREQTADNLQLVVDADEPGSYDIIVSNGPNPASSTTYQDAFTVVLQPEE